MRAFVEAESNGADGLELDVQMTKDGELVVIHDEKVDRTTDGKGFVKDLSAKDIRKLDASMQKLTTKESIPFLKEVFDWLAGNKLVCNVELKNGKVPYPELEEKVIALVKDYGLEERIILSSFNHYSIVHATTIAPEIETAPLLAEGLYMPWVYAKAIRAKGYHPHYLSARDELVKQAIAENIKVRPYTVNKQSEMVRLMNIGCHAIITDKPDHALQIRMDLG